ncbi:MAG: flagellar basal body rod C-terminal domain-containing protein [Candidatus Puniceispirillales bacterium]
MLLVQLFPPKINFPEKVEDVFTSSSNPLVATTFLKDGPVTTIPSSTKSINLSSLGNQSSGSFTISDADIKGFSSFNIKLDNANEITISSASTDPGDGIKSVKEFADLLNSGLMLDGKSQHDFKNYGLFASGSNGYLTIASSISDISSSSILSKGNSYTPTISNITAASSLASNVQVFTRDGRHVSGTSLNAAEIASLIKTDNGFLESAEYRNDYLNNNYRGINLSRKTVSGDFVRNFGSNISYNEQATDMDGLLTSKTVTTGSISLDGLRQYSKELNSNISIACEKDESGRTFTIAGYDLDGLYQTETITGGNATTVTGSKIFRKVSNVSIDGNSAGKITIGTEAVSSSLKITNSDSVVKTTNVPVGSSAYYLANKLKTELAGSGVNLSASTSVMLGPLDEGVSGAFTFDLKGKNTDAVSINTSVSATDLSLLAKSINEYSSQTGLTANVTSDFKRIIITSEDGHNINFNNVTAPSDFYLETIGQDFTNLNIQTNPKLLIDVSDSKKSSANIKGEIKFVSSENFTVQTDSGVVWSSAADSLKNGYIDVQRSKTGEIVTITPEVFNDLDNSLGSPDGKKATVGLSKYGLDINQKDYNLYIRDGNSLYESANPGAATTLSLDGKLKDANNLNAIVSIYSTASETGNTFTVTGTNLAGTTITEAITGGSTGERVYGSTIFQTITSITTSATASGNIKIGTYGYNAINDDDSLVQWTSFSSGSISMDGVLSTADYLGAKIKIKSQQDTTGTSFVIAGLGLNNEVITETITGSNGGIITTSNIFKTVTSINSSGTSNGRIRIGTEAADGNWNTTIDANALNIDTQKDISTALLSSLRSETPTSQLKGIVLNSLPSEGQSVDLSFEGQVYSLKMVSGELVVDGPETNRIKARFNGTSENISNLISTSQTGTAATPLIINGLNSVAADSDGLVELMNPSGAGVISRDGALKDSTSLNSRITIKNRDNDDNTPFKYTITGTDQDGNVITDVITGVNGDNAVNTGTKVFKTVTEVKVDGDSGEIEVGTIPAFASSSGTRVSITSTANESENTFTIAGTDTDGLSKTETIVGPTSGKTVSSLGLFKTITSITPTSNTVGNVEIGTSPGYELIATAEGTIEGAQFKIVPTTTNVNNSQSFGLKTATTTVLGNFVAQPLANSEGVNRHALGIEVTENDVVSNYSIKFNNNNIPVFYDSTGTVVSASPPSGITLSWSETSGITDDDSIYNSNMSAGVAIITSGILSTTDDDSLFTSKSATAGDLVLDGPLESSKTLNGKVTIFCNGNETSNSFVVSGYDLSGVYKTDTISGVNNSTATGSISFSEIISISAASNTASTIKVGTQATQVTMDPQVITITPAGSDVGEKYTITGLDQFGKSQTEVIYAQAAGTKVIGEKVFTQITSIVPGSASASTVKVGTQKVGRLSISHTIDKLDFKVEGNPRANYIFGFKTDNIRAVVDNDGLKVSSFSGVPVKVDIPSNSIQNSVAEKISLDNLPPEDLITIVMGTGARKISAEFDQYAENDNVETASIPELTIKVDATNNNKVEIFDKKSGHSIASRILDVNRVFNVNNTKFQFSEAAVVNNSFEFSSNKDGFGDNRNIINLLNLQGSDKSGGNKGNFQEIFNTTVAKVGSNVQASQLSLDSASSTLDAAEASQSEFAGVNLDEEAAHLLEFQQAYQASARILQTAKEMFQSLIEVV